MPPDNGIVSDLKSGAFKCELSCADEVDLMEWFGAGGTYRTLGSHLTGKVRKKHA